ncbi:putative nucleotidyltransferase, ribonuclease H, partial [Tanacetum coccineum]
MLDCEVNGVTNRGGKNTTQDVHNNDTNGLPKEPVVVEPEKPAEPNEVLTNDQPQITNKSVVQPSNEVQPPPVPFPKRLRKEKDEAQQKKFLENLKQLHINLPFIEVLAQMLKYDKFLKGLLTNKIRLEEACKIIMNERCSVVLLNKLPSKEKNPGSFTIPCDIGQLHINNALADLGASISLMPYTMYKKLGLVEPKATRMSLELADRPFLATARAMIDVFNKKITLRVGDDEVIFDVDQSIKRPTTEDDECYGIDDLDETINESLRNLECCESTSSNDKNGSDSENSIRHIDSINTPYPVTQGTSNGDNVKSEHLYSASANEIDEKKPELKNLPQHLEYAYLHGDKSFPIIISSELSKNEKTSLLQVLERRKGAIAWKMSDIKGISPSYCTHKILMEDDYKPVIQPQRRLNPKVQDVVKNKIVKLLDSGLIYPISDSSWVSPIHVVPKKGGMTVVLNDNNELIPSRTVTGWRVCIDYRKLNDANSNKDHFPLPFIDQMLERLCGNEYYCFLDGFSGFFQIPIAPEDQEKTTFTCPYGTFAYRRMPFGLCNAPATFQRCMTAIFHDMVEDFMGSNLDRMLARCEETNLVLNWEKCHFMVKEGIVLGHKISGAGIEVDRAKIDVIAKLPYPTNVKGVRSFLGHAGFYRRFIKDFSMISKPMTQLLMKDVRFDFFDDCKRAFNILKEKLTTTPIIISPDWNEPFKLMCDASDFAVGAVLGQQIDGKFNPIYYASKTLNNAQEHYTTTEKELLAVVFSFDKFRQYLVLSKTMVYTDHSALKYLFSKEDAKPRLIRLENPDLGTFAEEEIIDEFLDEHLMILKAELNNDEPWKVYESGFYWPSIFKDAKDYVMKYDASAAKNRFIELNELMELRHEAYENTRIYKERTKKWHDSSLRGDKNFKEGDKVLIFNSRFKMHPGTYIKEMDKNQSKNGQSQTQEEKSAQ